MPPSYPRTVFICRGSGVRIHAGQSGRELTHLRSCHPRFSKWVVSDNAVHSFQPSLFLITRPHANSEDHAIQRAAVEVCRQTQIALHAFPMSLRPVAPEVSVGADDSGVGRTASGQVGGIGSSAVRQITPVTRALVLCVVVVFVVRRSSAQIDIRVSGRNPGSCRLRGTHWSRTRNNSWRRPPPCRRRSR